MGWLKEKILPPSQDYHQRALKRQSQLTKPPGSLGVLEEIGVRLAAMQGADSPEAEHVWISVFAADHGVAEESVSAFPQSVTAEMVKNFASGGAAISVLARQVNATLEIVDTGILRPVLSPEIINNRAGAATASFLQQKAMSKVQLNIAMEAGKLAVERALNKGAQIYIGGEMGIGNTTSASACASVILDIDPIDIAGAGTGLDAAGISRKVGLIKQAIKKHSQDLDDPLSVLECLGGFEIAALVGAFLYAAQHQLPVVVDGFIATVASLVVVKIQPEALAWFFYAHCSAEKGHQLILKALSVIPILDLNMRLGEGSGAAVVVPLIRAACALHNQMATFDQAKVSTG
jgi:nicotinate-nucleotide--dimethylbenzimidazole phosphoribosyltransferase